MHPLPLKEVGHQELTTNSLYKIAVHAHHHNHKWGGMHGMVMTTWKLKYSHRIHTYFNDSSRSPLQLIATAACQMCEVVLLIKYV